MRGKIDINIGSQSGKFKSNSRLFDVLNRGSLVLIGTFVFLNPFPQITSIKEILFYLSTLIVLILLVFKKTKFSFRTPLLLPFGLFIFWALFSIFFALDKGGSLRDFYSHLVKYIIFYYVMINLFKSRKGLDTLSWIIIISATVFSVGLLFYFHVVRGVPLSTRLASGFKNSATDIIDFITLFGLILSSHKCFKEKYLYRKIFLIFSLFPLFAVSFLTQSRGSLFAMMLASAVLLFNKKKTLVCFVGGLLILIALSPMRGRVNINKWSNDPRIGLAYFSLEIIKDYPIVGTGFSIDTFRNTKLIDLEEYKARIPEKFRSQPFLWPHNMFLSIGVRVGLVGLALFVCILLVFVKMCWKMIKYGRDDFVRNWSICILSAIVMFLVKGLCTPVFTHFVDVIFYTILSMATILWRLNEETSTRRAMEAE